jgi:hypothetical protein
MEDKYNPMKILRRAASFFPGSETSPDKCQVFIDIIDSENEFYVIWAKDENSPGQWLKGIKHHTSFSLIKKENVDFQKLGKVTIKHKDETAQFTSLDEFWRGSHEI